LHFQKNCAENTSQFKQEIDLILTWLVYSQHPVTPAPARVRPAGQLPAFAPRWFLSTGTLIAFEFITAKETLVHGTA
jgi:hypothetical protein